MQRSLTNATISNREYKPQGRVFFPNLDGLRFIAFFMVFFQHGFSAALPTHSDSFLLQRLIKLSAELGGRGVSFFFVLSGFLITYLILSEIAWTGRIDVIAFYIRRILRIWPLYYLVLAFAFIIYPALKTVIGFSSYIQAGNPLWYLFFLSNFDVMRMEQGQGAMMIGITWSVAIEEQFYLIWPLLFFLLPYRSYKYIFPTIIFASLLFRVANAYDGRVLYFHSLSVISDMAVGGLMAYLAFKKPSFTAFFSKLSKEKVASIYLGGLIMFLFEDHIFSGHLLGAAQRLASSLFFAFIILEQNYASGSLLKMGKSGLLTEWGKYTYGLYLLHPIAIQFCIVGFRILQIKSDGVSVSIFKGCAALALSFLLAYGSYYWYEKRFLALKSRFSHLRTT